MFGYCFNETYLSVTMPLALEFGDLFVSTSVRRILQVCLVGVDRNAKAVIIRHRLKTPGAQTAIARGKGD